MSDNPQYDPSTHFDNVNTLFGNHYRFVLDGLPDLTFFVQGFTLPSVISSPILRSNPFVRIPEVGDHLDFNSFSVTYLIDNSFKTYFSLWAWMKGYAFPTSYEDIAAFEAARMKQIPNPRPQRREIQKTNGTLTILQPDNDTPICEIQFFDAFPTALGEVPFGTVDSEPTQLKTHVSFYYTDFDVRLTNT